MNLITDKMVEAALGSLPETVRASMTFNNMLGALQAAQSAAPPPSADDAPAGYRLVPATPTEKMIRAAWDVDTSDRQRNAAIVYAAMLATAPDAPRSGDAPVVWADDDFYGDGSRMHALQLHPDPATNAEILIGALCARLDTARQALAQAAAMQVVQPALESIKANAAWAMNETDPRRVLPRSATYAPPVSAPADAREGEQDERDREVGRKWRTNSSLEEWFPCTADQLARAEADAPRIRYLMLEMSSHEANRIGVLLDGGSTDDMRRVIDTAMGAGGGV